MKLPQYRKLRASAVAALRRLLPLDLQAFLAADADAERGLLTLLIDLIAEHSDPDGERADDEVEDVVSGHVVDLYLNVSAMPLTSRFTISPVWVPLNCSTAPFWLVRTIACGPRMTVAPAPAAP